jgi:hypothetical protein
MNEIYEKSRVKRKYKKKLTCPNKMGICEIDKCRCDMAIKAKNFPKGIKINHKLQSKAEWNLEQKQKLINDLQNIDLMEEEYVNNEQIEGYIVKEKRRKQKLQRIIWRIGGILVAILIVYLLIINLFNL